MSFNILVCHIIAFALGYALDLIIGDPHGAPHPIRLIGRFIAFLEKKWNADDKQTALKNGRKLVIVVSGSALIITAAIMAAAYLIHPYVGIAAEAVLMYYILAARSLYDESMAVYRRLKKNDTDGARKSVSMIVGRDTAMLDENGITKAAVETVAENASDGVIAPMLYTAIGGPALGMFYKSVNTMDSMVGYKNDKYLNFGRAAALTDDVLNFIPSRISAYIMIFSCVFLGKEFNTSGAYKIHKRDARKHASPNAAQTESVCAGALGIRLAGDASYFGKIYRKPYIGDVNREVVFEDIKRANRLMLASSFICEAACIAIGIFLISAIF